MDSRVLEIAIGTDRIALPLLRHVRAIYGVNLPRPMMERLRAKQARDPFRLAQGDITRLPFKSGSLAGALAGHFVHLVRVWQGALREVARVLRPGSVLVTRLERRMWSRMWRLTDDELTPAGQGGACRYS